MNSSTDYWFPTAFSVWGEEEHAAIARVIASGRFTMGPEVEAFEAEFAAWHGMRYGIMVNSGSSANLVAVAALREDEWNRSDTDHIEIFVPALAWSTTYSPLIQHGLNIRLVDCDSSWNAPTSAYDTVAVPILGNPAHMVSNVILMDCCESLGAVGVDGRKCGTQGLLNTFSFFYSHQISAIEGGMILTNDEALDGACRILRSHGWTRDVAKADSFDKEYCFTQFGYNVRPTEIHAAVAREQLKKLPQTITARQLNASLFCDLTTKLDLPLEHPTVAGYASPFGLPFMVRDPGVRSKVVAALREEGIDCRPPTGGSFRLHPYGGPWRDQPTPNADRIHRCGLFIGNPPYAFEEGVDKAVDILYDVLSK